MVTSSRAPCAACKFLRRKCAPECVFAPHFPQNCLSNFVTVHKAFGANNVARILSDLPLHLRDEAVNSLCFDAETILNDKINGCHGPIENLSAQRSDIINQTNAVIAEIFTLAGDSAVDLLDQIRAAPVDPLDISSASWCAPQEFTHNHQMDGPGYREMESVNRQTMQQAGSMFFSQSVNRETMQDFPPLQQDSSMFFPQPVSQEMMQDLLNNHQMDGMVYSGMESVDGDMMQDLPPLQRGSTMFYPRPFNPERMQNLPPMQQDSSMFFAQPFNEEMMRQLPPQLQDVRAIPPMDNPMMFELSHLLELESL